MFGVFMVGRSRSLLLSAVALFALAFVGSACEKVPLFAPTGSTIALSILPGPNGTTQILAQVIEPAGTPPHSGTHVTFSTTLGTVQPAEALTDVSGRAVATFQAASGESGFATITAVSGGVKASTCCVAVGSAAVGAIVATANPSVISSRGGSATITAHVTDGSGNVLAGIPVAFTTDAGTLSPTVATTDGSGNAQTTLTTTRTANVTATAGVTVGSDGKAITPPSSKVTVAVNVTSTITVGTPTPASPTVGQTVAFPVTYGNATGSSPIVRVNVDWGDGTTSAFNNAPSAISHVYSRSGGFLVTVTGFDALGDTASGSGSVTVAPRPAPVVTIKGTVSTSVPRLVTFDIGVTGNTGPITSLFVDFGDGNSITLPNNATSVQHQYNAAGTYQATATATDASGASGSGSTVIVLQ
jgi:PKD domain/Bacterial Ig-like domain (group 1)